MRAVILNGETRSGGEADAAAAMLELDLAARGYGVRHFILRDHSVGHCLGEFDCWLKHPGRCRIHDEGQEIERAVHDADLYALVTPITFTGYSAQLKKAADRLIPLILPFFAVRDGLTHHAHRYARLPHLVAIGTGWNGDHGVRRTFLDYAENNALNFGTPSWSWAVLGADPDQWRDDLDRAIMDRLPARQAQGSLHDIEARLHDVLRADRMPRRFGSVSNVCVLQVSAREAGTSTSQSIAKYVTARFAQSGVATDIVQASAFARDAQTAAREAQKLANADILVVVSPLYVGTLPYLGILALESALAARASVRGPQRVIGIVNCGFPEPEHTRFAFYALRAFAEAAGASYAGGLPVGGGELIEGAPLQEPKGETPMEHLAAVWTIRRLRSSIDSAVDSLLEGGGVPEAASLAMARPPAPPILYRLVGTQRWRRRARASGHTIDEVFARPFDTISDQEWRSQASLAFGRARPLRVVDKVQETNDAISIHFEDPTHDPLNYRAGQHITVELTVDGTLVRRSYSLASIPEDAGLAITVKRVPGGLVSNYLHDALDIGSIVKAYGPSGKFTLPEPKGEARRLLMFAGGSGIVPIAAMIRETLLNEPNARVTLVYGAARKSRAIFAELLEGLAALFPDRIEVRWILELADEGAAGVVLGRMDEVGLGRALIGIDWADVSTAYVCGPDGMRESVKSFLVTSALPREQIVEESFVSPRPAPCSSKAETVSIIADNGARRDVLVKPGQSLLDAMLDAGEAISFSCMSGGCGACRITIVDGLDNCALDEPNDLTADDRRAGRLLSCITRVKGPVTVQIGT